MAGSRREVALSVYRSPLLEAVAADEAAVLAAAKAARLPQRHVAAVAAEELRLLEQVGGGDKYASLRQFLSALGRRR